MRFIRIHSDYDRLISHVKSNNVGITKSYVHLNVISSYWKNDFLRHKFIVNVTVKSYEYTIISWLHEIHVDK